MVGLQRGGSAVVIVGMPRRYARERVARASWAGRRSPEHRAPRAVDPVAVEFGSFPHENGLMDLLWERSPIRYVHKVSTPVMFVHGENDNDVPIAEAEQYYIALRDAGVKSIMVRYPREGHGIRETKHVIDVIDRSIQWYREHFTRSATSSSVAR